MTNEIKCLRCGACCVRKTDGKDCKYLIRLSNGKTLCRIYSLMYNTHGKKKIYIGTDSLGNKRYCIPREESEFDYPNCPYNTNKPIFVPKKL